MKMKYTIINISIFIFGINGINNEYQYEVLNKNIGIII